MTHDQFQIRARAYIIKKYGSLQACSKSYGAGSKSLNMFSRCLSGDRDFPTAFLHEMGYRPVEKRRIYTRYTKAELEVINEVAI